MVLPRFHGRFRTSTTTNTCQGFRHGSNDAELYHAANEQALHLHRAQRRLEGVLNLAGVLRASIGDEGDSRAMQAETVLKIAERRLNKALDQLDRHDSRHRELFFAYFDLQDTMEEGGGGRAKLPESRVFCGRGLPLLRLPYRLTAKKR